MDNNGSPQNKLVGNFFHLKEVCQLEIIRAVIGNLKHEGVELELDELQMLQKLIDGEISEEEFDQWAIEKVM